MVLDNADDAELFFNKPAAASSDSKLCRFLPVCAHSAMLVTTRDKELGSRLAQGAPPVEVGQMSEDESVGLLRGGLRCAEGDAELLELSSRLEHLPLALAQAAAFTQENSISVTKYMQLLGESDQGLVELLSQEFEAVGRDSEAAHAVALTWMLSFQQMERQSGLAGELISLMSLLDRQGIPKEFLSSYNDQRNATPKSRTEDLKALGIRTALRLVPRKLSSQMHLPGRKGIPLEFLAPSSQKGQTGQASDEMDLTEAIGVLKGFCFVTEEKSGNLNMHRLVQLVTRQWLARKGTISRFSREALHVVSVVYPYGSFETRAVCSAYLPHATDVLQLGKGKSKDEHRARALLPFHMATHLNFEGHWDEAEELSKEAVEIERKVLGKKHPDTLTSMNNLASTYSNHGQWEEAETLQVQVMEMSKSKLGADHPSTLISMNNLACTWQRLGKVVDATDLMRECIRLRQIKLGLDHPHTQTSISTLYDWDRI